MLSGCALPRIIVLNDPLTAGQHNDLGVAYEQRHDYDLALRAFSRAAELDKDWGVPLVNRGNVHAALGDWRQAEKSYRLALRRQGDDATAMNNLAWALLQRGEHDEALHFARRAVILDGHPAILDTLAEVHLARGEKDAARDVVAQALAMEMAPTLRQALQAKETLLAAEAP